MVAASDSMKAALDATRDAFYLLAAVRADGAVIDFSIEELNREAEEYLGCSGEQIRGVRLQEGFPFNATKTLLPSYLHVLKQGTSFHARFPSELRPGRWLDLRAIRIDDDRIAVSARDVTSEVERQHALQQSLVDERKARGDLEASMRELQQVNQRLSLLAKTDGLTGLWNHRSFHERLNSEIALSTRHRHTFSLLMIDVDLFKAYNDRHGHPAGDDLLAGLAKVFQESLRTEDYLSRYGGEEFAAILPLVDLSGAQALAERLRERVEAWAGPCGRVTVSVGGATWVMGESNDSLLRRADDSLYEAKRSGRNRVMMNQRQPSDHKTA